MLKLSFGNSKIKKLAVYLGLAKNQVASFDLPAGYTCPAARACRSYANRKTGKITDGKGAEFRCYAASSEAVFKSARDNRWHNFEALRVAGADMVSLILRSIPDTVKVLRIHSSGDFFTRAYFDAWVAVARALPDVKFFGYTKILPYVKADKPDNFTLVYSFGGTMDALVTDEPVAYVVNTVDDGIARGLPVSCQDNPVDDYDYVTAGKSFALALHGTQPKGKGYNNAKHTWK